MNYRIEKISVSDPKISIRLFIETDIPIIVSHFADHQWPKPRSTFDNYLSEQKTGDRLVWVAYYDDQFAGYITLKWQSQYESFREKSIPEIMDLNVLPPFRRKGIASKLLTTAETETLTKSNIVGLGVGLYQDYGSAQKLYSTRDYLPDGLGITYNYKRVSPGEKVELDDNLVLWLTKILA